MRFLLAKTQINETLKRTDEPLHLFLVDVDCPQREVVEGALGRLRFTIVRCGLAREGIFSPSSTKILTTKIPQSVY